VGARISAPVQTGPGAYPASCTMGTGSFPEVKWPGRGVDHPPPSSAEVKERVELYLYSPSGSSWLVTGRTLPSKQGAHVESVSLIFTFVIESEGWMDRRQQRQEDTHPSEPYIVG
jgi:hypothetical protein